MVLERGTLLYTGNMNEQKQPGGKPEDFGITPPENLPVRDTSLPEDFFVQAPQKAAEKEHPQKVTPKEEVISLLKKGEGKRALELMTNVSVDYFDTTEEWVETFTQYGYLHELARHVFELPILSRKAIPKTEEVIIEAVALHEHPDKLQLLRELLPRARMLSGETAGVLLAAGLHMGVIEQNIQNFSKDALKNIHITPNVRNVAFLVERLGSLDKKIQSEVVRFVLAHSGELPSSLLF